MNSVLERINPCESCWFQLSYYSEIKIYISKRLIKSLETIVAWRQGRGCDRSEQRNRKVYRKACLRKKEHMSRSITISLSGMPFQFAKRLKQLEAEQSKQRPMFRTAEKFMKCLRES